MIEHYEARFAAVGGQGIILAGDILAYAAIKYGQLYALDSPTYTAQVRGGPTKVDVIIDKRKILFPRTIAIDFMLCLAQRSWDRFGQGLKPNCILLVDPNLVHDVDRSFQVYELPIIAMTKREMKRVVYTSAVSLGAMIGLTNILNPELVIKALIDKAPKGTEIQNERAFMLGYNEAQKLIN